MLSSNACTSDEFQSDHICVEENKQSLKILFILMKVSKKIKLQSLRSDISIKQYSNLQLFKLFKK